MKTIINIYLIFLSSFIFTSSAMAEIYYVSPSGSDESPGTQADPWKTINKVNTVNFLAGDSILFQGGQTFFGTINFGINDKGSATNPITVSSYGAGRAVIDGGSGSGFIAYNTAGIKINDINFTSNGSTKNSKNGITFYTDLPKNVQLDTIIIENVDINEFGLDGISIGGWNGLSGFKNVTINYVSSHNNGLNGIQIYEYEPTSSGYANSNFYIGHSLFYNNAGIAGYAGPSGSGATIDGVDTVLVERSVFYNNGINNTNSSGPVGLYAWGSTNVTFQYNESYANKSSSGTDGDGFDLDGGVSNSVMQYNYSHDNAGGGFLLCQYAGASRHQNNNVIRYNISQNDARTTVNGSIVLWNGNSGGSGGISDAWIYNNDVFMSPNGTNSVRYGIAVKTPVTNVNFENNIVYTVPGAGAVSVVNGQVNVMFQNNNFWSSNGDPVLEYANALHESNLIEDPQLTNPGGGLTINNPDDLNSLSAYQLLSSSGLIDRGLNILKTYGINPGANNFYGASVPDAKGGYDIGAY